MKARFADTGVFGCWASHTSSHFPLHYLSWKGHSKHQQGKSPCKPQKFTTGPVEEEGWVDSLVSSCTYTISASTLSRGSVGLGRFHLFFYLLLQKLQKFRFFETPLSLPIKLRLSSRFTMYLYPLSCCRVPVTTKIFHLMLEDRT